LLIVELATHCVANLKSKEVLIPVYSQSQDENDKKLDELKIQDFEMGTEPPAHIQIESTKILARWLINRWMIKHDQRKSLTFSFRSISYRSRLKRQIVTPKTRLKGARKS